MNKLLLVFILLPLTAKAAPKTECALFSKAVKSGSATQRLNRFFDAQWKYAMTEFPEYATFTGYPGQNDRLSDQSLEALEKHRLETRCQLKSLISIPRASLASGDRMNYDLNRRELERRIEGDKFPSEFLPINQLNGIQSDFADLLAVMPTANRADYENIIKRLEKLPVLEGQIESLLREGVKRRVVGVKMFLPKVLQQIDGLIPAKVEDSPLYKPFVEMNASLAPSDREALQKKALEVIGTQVYPAFRNLRAYLEKEYIPSARETTAWTEMPDGKAWYAYLVKGYTTTDKTPEELHELGLKEVARITAEMDTIRKQVGFKGDLKAFNKFLLTDKQFYYTSEEELLRGFRDIAKRLDPELPRLFKTLPRLSYGVKPVPAFKAAAAPGAYYEGGTLEAGRPGYFVANTYDLKSRPKWIMETLTMHEAVPGHHFQIAIAQELENMPNFRRFGDYTAYSEGWALYAESLGGDMGFFKDPYMRYGHLAEEMMRAIRLVVDTGLHSKGWPKQQALDFFRGNMPTSNVESEVEIDRYITWPGQALAYKVGQLKIRELRTQAQTQLGEGFDVRDFHDEILRHGALPMDVLEKVIGDWVSARKRAAAKARKA